MVTQNNSRALLKKLSALRAILSDSERNLLDTLLLSSCERTYYLSGGADDSTTATDGPGDPSLEGNEKPNVRIRFDREREVYVME